MAKPNYKDLLQEEDMDGVHISRQLEQRIVTIEGAVTEALTCECIAQMLFLAHESEREPIVLSVNSPGGHVISAIAIIRAMNDVKCPISTFCRDHAGGVAAAIVGHGSRGFRSASPTATFGFAPIWINPKEGCLETEISQLDQALVEIVAEDTGRHERQVHSLFSRQSILSAAEAQTFGLIDAVSSVPKRNNPPHASGWRGHSRQMVRFVSRIKPPWSRRG